MVGEWLRTLRARRAERRAAHRAERGERALRKAEAEALRLEHRRKVTASGGDGGGVL